MSQIYEALKQSEKDGTGALLVPEKTQTAPSTEKPVVPKAVPVFEDEAISVSPNPKKPLVAFTDEHSIAGEKFRILANRLAFISRSQNLKLIQVTSAVAGEGKSIVAANLALMLSRRHQERVLLIEGDIHRPSQMDIFGTQPRPGLGEWWEHTSERLPRIFRIDDSRVWLLPAGRVRRHSEILQSARLPQLLKDARQSFDWVIVDSPPMLPLADTNLWARWADGTLLVVREGVTPKRALQKGLDNLDNPKIIGIVLNETSEDKRVNYYAQYYGGRKTTPTSTTQTEADD